MSRTALVTGAGRGIGRATSERLAAAGWQVIGVDREWPDGQPDGCWTADLADPAPVADRIGGLERLDGLVNNAAINEPGSLEATDAATWARTFEVNLTAAFALIQAAIPALAASTGSIVNVASVHALSTSSGNSAYAAAKAGLVGLSRSAALELGPRGVRVNAVLPGAVDTDMLQPGTEGDARKQSLDELVTRTPLGRVARPDEIAAAIEFLLDGERASFITGQTLVVDGGVLARLASE